MSSSSSAGFWQWNDPASNGVGQDFAATTYRQNALAVLWAAINTRYNAIQNPGLMTFTLGNYADKSWEQIQGVVGSLGQYFLDLSDGIQWIQNTGDNYDAKWGGYYYPKFIKKVGRSDYADPFPINDGQGFRRKAPREIWSRTATYTKGASVIALNPATGGVQAFGSGGPQCLPMMAIPAVEGDIARLVWGRGQAAGEYTNPVTPAVPETPDEDMPFLGEYFKYTSGSWVQLTGGKGRYVLTPSSSSGGSSMTMADILAGSIVSDFGSYQFGDYIGMWLIEDANDMINQYTTTVQVGGCPGNGVVPYTDTPLNRNAAGLYLRNWTYRTCSATYPTPDGSRPASMEDGLYQAEGVCDQHFGGNSFRTYPDPGTGSPNPFPSPNVYEWNATKVIEGCQCNISFGPNISGYASSGPSSFAIDGYGETFYGSAEKESREGDVYCTFDDPYITNSNYLNRTVTLWGYCNNFRNTDDSPPPSMTNGGYHWNCPAGYPYNVMFEIGTMSGTCTEIGPFHVGTEAAPEWKDEFGEYYSWSNGYYTSTGYFGWTSFWSLDNLIATVEWDFPYSTDHDGTEDGDVGGSPCTPQYPCGLSSSSACADFNIGSCCETLKIQISSPDGSETWYATSNGDDGYNGDNVTIVWVPDDTGLCQGHYLMTLSPQGMVSSSSGAGNPNTYTYASTTTYKSCLADGISEWTFTGTDDDATLVFVCWDTSSSSSGRSSSSSHSSSSSSAPSSSSGGGGGSSSSTGGGSGPGGGGSSSSAVGGLSSSSSGYTPVLVPPGTSSSTAGGVIYGDCADSLAGCCSTYTITLSGTSIDGTYTLEMDEYNTGWYFWNTKINASLFCQQGSEYGPADSAWVLIINDVRAVADPGDHDTLTSSSLVFYSNLYACPKTSWALSSNGMGGSPSVSVNNDCLNPSSSSSSSSNAILTSCSTLVCCSTYAATINGSVDFDGTYNLTRTEDEYGFAHWSYSGAFNISLYCDNATESWYLTVVTLDNSVAMYFDAPLYACPPESSTTWNFGGINNGLLINPTLSLVCNGPVSSSSSHSSSSSVGAGCCSTPFGTYDDGCLFDTHNAVFAYSGTAYSWTNGSGTFENHITPNIDGVTFVGSDSGLTAVWDGCNKLTFSNGCVWSNQTCAGVSSSSSHSSSSSSYGMSSSSSSHTSSSSSSGGSYPCSAVVNDALPSGRTFDGTAADAYVLGTGSVYNITAGITLQATINTTSTRAYQRVISKQTDDSISDSSYVLGIAPSGGIYFGLFDGSSQYAIEGGTAVNTGTTTTIGGTWDGTTMQIYINGTLQSETEDFEGVMVTSDQPLQVGAGNTDARGFIGTISNVYVFPCAIDESEPP